MHFNQEKRMVFTCTYNLAAGRNVTFAYVSHLILKIKSEVSVSTYILPSNKLRFRNVK